MAQQRRRAVYQIKVTVHDVEPPIWRRIQIWEDATLTQLHRVLQVALGWEDCHLHEFIIERRAYGFPDPEDDFFCDRKAIDERRERLRNVVPRVGTRFAYHYDFGDSWWHDLLLESIVLPEPQAQYPRCLAGERRAPPENVGGPSGYARFLEAISHPERGEQEDSLQWQGPFDPASFSLDAINERLHRTFCSRKKSGANVVAYPEPQSNRALAGASAVRLPSRLDERPKGAPKPGREEEIVPLDLNERERQLFLEHSFAEERLRGRLRIVPKPNSPPVYHFTLEELDELVDLAAAEANRVKDEQLKKEWKGLHTWLSTVQDSYSDN